MRKPLSKKVTLILALCLIGTFAMVLALRQPIAERPTQDALDSSANVDEPSVSQDEPSSRQPVRVDESKGEERGANPTRLVVEEEAQVPAVPTVGDESDRNLRHIAINENQQESLRQEAQPSEVSEEELASGSARSATDGTFAMPADAEYCQNEVLISVDASADPALLEDLLARTPGIQAQSIDEEDLASGLIKVQTEPGVSVEDGINAVRQMRSPLVRGSQPNYVYHLMESGSPTELVAQAGTLESTLSKSEAGEARASRTADVEPEPKSAPVVAPDEERNRSEEAGEAEEVGEEQKAEAEQTAEGEQRVLQPSVSEASASSDGRKEEVGSAPAEPQPQNQPQNQSQGQPQNQPQGQPINELPPLAALSAVTIDDPRQDDLWGLKSMRAYDAWGVAKCEGTVSVAVLDNGFDLSHEDLADNIIEGSAYNSYDGGTDISPVTGHGTHVAGIVSAVANNNKGVAGISYNAKIVPIKVFNSKGEATSDSLVEAYDYVSNHPEYNVRVINLSLGAAMPGDFGDDALIEKVRAARDNGIVSVAASCNVNASHDASVPATYWDDEAPYYAYPSDSEAFVGVINLQGYASTTNANDASGLYNVSRCSSSNYNVEGQGGPNTDKGKNICAPGTGIMSTMPGGSSYDNDTGTSMASPYVAGIVALEFAANPSLTATQAVDYLYNTAHDLGNAGWDEEYGHGEANAFGAVRLVAGESQQSTVREGVVRSTLHLPGGPYTYDGTAKAPEPEVVYVSGGRSTELVRGHDFEVAYRSNIDAGSAVAVVTGIGDYEGFEHELSFVICCRELSSTTIELSADEWLYDNRAICPSVVGVFYGESQLIEGKDYSADYTYANNQNVGTATVTLQGLGNYAGLATKEFAINPRPLTSDAITAVLSQAEYAFSGSAQLPNVTVTHKNALSDSYTLVKDQDYSLAYEDNVHAGEATVTITGKNSYTGSLDKKFTITPIALQDSDVTLRSQAWLIGVTPEVEVVHNGVTLALGTDYTVSCEGNDAPGTSTVSVVGKGDYKGTVTKEFTVITERISLSDEQTTVSVNAEGLAYTGKPLEPVVTVAHGGRTLQRSVDYELAYERNVDAGEAAAVVTGKGHYEGTVKKAFAIEKALVDAPVSKDGLVYSGKEQEGVEASDGCEVEGGRAIAAGDYEATTMLLEGGRNHAWRDGASGARKVAWRIAPATLADGDVKAEAEGLVYTGKPLEPTVTVTHGGRTLQRSVDYELAYERNVDAGDAAAVVTGKGNYAGTARRTFAIAKAVNPLSAASRNATVSVTYNPSAAQATAANVVTSNAVGVVSFANVSANATAKKFVVAAANGAVSVPAGTPAGTYDVGVRATAAGNKNYNVGTKTVVYKIAVQRAPIAGATVSGLSSYVHTGKALTPKPSIKLGGRTLREGTDYTLAYRNNVAAGTATVTATGKGNYAGTKSASFKITRAGFSMSAPAAQMYTGKAVRPKPVVRGNGRVLKEGTDYTLAYRNNINAGTATVTATGKGNYAGSRSANFKIVAPSVQYYVHRQTYGWETAWSKSNGQCSGTTGQSKRLEGIRIRLNQKPTTGSIQYRTHIQTYGWEWGWKSDGVMSGTTGIAKRLEAIQIRLTGNMGKYYDVYYRVHAQTYGWMGWAKNGANAGTAGQSKRLEAIQIVIVPKGAKAPAATYKGVRQNTAVAFLKR